MVCTAAVCTLNSVRTLNLNVMFFQDDEQDVFKRDFSAPTLEDHFNKTILPKVMQVRPMFSFSIYI